MNSINSIQQRLILLNENESPFITVNNSEWFSLFRDEIRNSIAIEGVFANRNELLNVLEMGRRTPNQKSAAILGYFEAASTLYDYAGNQNDSNEFQLRHADLKQIHTLLMRYEHQLGTFTGKLGGFRDENVAVTNSTFTPLDFQLIPDVLSVFIQWHNAQLNNAKLDSLTFVAASHIIFETIHPFRDGNGRVGRILLSYLLIGIGFINIAIKGTQKPDRQKYYHALEAGDDEIEAMLRRIEKGEKPTVARINKAIQKSDLSKIKLIIHKCLSQSLDRIEKGIKTHDLDAMIPLREAAKYFNYSQDYLRQLIHLEKLPAKKEGKLWMVKIRDIDKYSRDVEKSKSSLKN